MQHYFKAGDKVKLLKPCADLETGIVYLVGGLDGAPKIPYLDGHGACSCYENWELVTPAAVNNMVTLTKLQKENLSKDAQALIEVGALDAYLSISSSNTLLKMLVELNMKPLADLARKDIAEYEAKQKASNDLGEE